MENQVIAYFDKDSRKVTKVERYFEGQTKIENVNYKLFNFVVGRGIDIIENTDIDAYNDDGTRNPTEREILDNGIIRDRTEYELVEVGLLDEATYDASMLAKRKAAYREQTDPTGIELLIQKEIDDDFTAAEEAEMKAEIIALKTKIKANYPYFSQGKPPVIEEETEQEETEQEETGV